MKYKIVGGKKLSGEVNISGNKNSILPCMAAALLTEDEVTLENVPEIYDVEIFLKIFDQLGISFNKVGQILKIKANKIKSTNLPDDLVLKLRASILLVGPILAREGKVSFHYPGGDVIGRRSIQFHIDGFKKLGVSIKSKDLHFDLLSHEHPGSVEIFLEEASVTATENLILASVLKKHTVLGSGVISIRNAATEPHVRDLCKMLISMGAKIDGLNTDTLSITGVNKLSGTKFKIGCDYIEVATYAIAAFITGGSVKIICDPNLDLLPMTAVLEKFGLKLEKKDFGFRVNSAPIQAVEKIVTSPWPGFPTDLMSTSVVLATQAKGVTLCHDWMYESRMFFVDKLISMGANITIADPHRVLVSGPSKLHGRIVDTPDIRAGMALVLAALVAEGETIINKVELIERGYENVAGKLKSLGVVIKRLE